MNAALPLTAYLALVQLALAPGLFDALAARAAAPASGFFSLEFFRPAPAGAKGMTS